MQNIIVVTSPAASHTLLSHKHLPGLTHSCGTPWRMQIIAVKYFRQYLNPTPAHDHERSVSRTEHKHPAQMKFFLKYFSNQVLTFLMFWSTDVSWSTNNWFSKITTYDHHNCLLLVIFNLSITEWQTCGSFQSSTCSHGLINSLWQESWQMRGIWWKPKIVDFI